jgi:hypothetical protein
MLYEPWNSAPQLCGERRGRTNKEQRSQNRELLIPLHWARDPSELPDNYEQAFAKMLSTDKQPKMAELYQKQMDNLVNLGHAQKNDDRWTREL